MQQRRLRLGDILDDYCPRERRVTNHAVVAMVEQDVKQTRCTTCDAEHEYKDARVPVLRRKKDAGALVGGLTADALRSRPPAGGPDVPDESLALDALAPELAAELPPESDDDLDGAALLDEDTAADAPLVAAALEALRRLDDGGDTADDTDDGAAAPGEDDGPVHRRLIRATLPRVEGQATQEWKEPDFTVRQQGGRGGETDGNRPGQRSGGSGGGRDARPQQRWGGGGQPRRADGPQGHRGPGGPPGQRPRGGQPPGQPGAQAGPRQGGQGQPGQPRRPGQGHAGQRQQGPGQPARQGTGANHPHGRKRGR